MDLTEPARAAFRGSQGWLCVETDGSGTSIPCRALVHQEAPGPPVSSSSMRPFWAQRRSSLRSRRWTFPASLAQGGTREVTGRHHADQTLAFHHREVAEV